MGHVSTCPSRPQCFASSCIPPGDTLIRACARIIELVTEGTSVALDSDLSEPGVHTFYPAIRPDGNGDLVVAFRKR